MSEEENSIANWWATGDMPVRDVHRLAFLIDGRIAMLVCQEPQVNVVQFLKQFVELHFWLLGHFAQYCKQVRWLLHCVLLSSFLQVENLRPFALCAVFQHSVSGS